MIGTEGSLSSSSSSTTTTTVDAFVPTQSTTRSLPSSSSSLAFAPRTLSSNPYVGDDGKQQQWRCATCYSQRYKTMNFGLNSSSSSSSCESCNLPIREAMWSLWLPFQELSPRMKKRARIMYATKLELTISTLYPYADIVEKKKTKKK